MAHADLPLSSEVDKAKMREKWSLLDYWSQCVFGRGFLTPYDRDTASDYKTPRIKKPAQAPALLKAD
ncbi:hypothetical protein ED28_15535 [[Pantoea] beijingensis]|uniref:Uncharacterized protein n=1 Tax=[Pantoea] beijingensis TaxID=1324864 RepID=A0A443IAC4_9GAMM|nr:hypothetical protein ED28_15535 [[Pantoea] beijingensis]